MCENILYAQEKYIQKKQHFISVKEFSKLKKDEALVTANNITVKGKVAHLKADVKMISAEMHMKSDFAVVIFSKDFIGNDLTMLPVRNDSVKNNKLVDKSNNNIDNSFKTKFNKTQRRANKLVDGEQEEETRIVRIEAKNNVVLTLYKEEMVLYAHSLLYNLDKQVIIVYDALVKNNNIEYVTDIFEYDIKKQVYHIKNKASKAKEQKVINIKRLD